MMVQIRIYREDGVIQKSKIGTTAEVQDTYSSFSWLPIYFLKNTIFLDPFNYCDSLIIGHLLLLFVKYQHIYFLSFSHCKEQNFTELGKIIDMMPCESLDIQNFNCS